MITPEQKKHLRKILGNDYVSKVLDCLKEKGITSPRGEHYSASAVKGVLNAGNNNLDIEECIYELANEILGREEKIRAIRDKMLGGGYTATVDTDPRNIEVVGQEILKPYNP